MAKIDFGFEVHPVVAILGPRQCGKTTLARMYADRLDNESVTRFDLEDPTHLVRLATPKLALEDLTGLIIIDEIQRASEQLPVLRGHSQHPVRFNATVLSRRRHFAIDPGATTS